MTHKTLATVTIVVLVGLSSPAGSANEALPHREAVESDAALAKSAIATLGQLPLSFEANQGQTDPRVRFLSRGNGQTLFLTSTAAVLVARDTRDVLRLAMVGPNQRAQVLGLEQLPGKSNYLVGNDSRKWHTNVPRYKKVHYDDVYPGIDLVYYGNAREFEFDFIVAPGADPTRIRLRIDGASRASIGDGGDIVLIIGDREIRIQRPRLYQDIDGVRQAVAGAYLLKGRELRFRVGTYDRRQPLVIDPVLVYSTYLGGNGTDGGAAIAVDTGSVYVTGITDSTDFPTAPGAYKPKYGTVQRTLAFVTKIDPSKSGDASLVYSTYLGGNSADLGRKSAERLAGDAGTGIAADWVGRAYVTGWTNSESFPVTAWSAFQPTYAGGGDGFAAILNDTGSDLLYSTFVGGSGADVPRGIAVGRWGGDAYVTGETTSTDFPATNGAYQQTLGGTQDAFVLKVTENGYGQWATYLGGSDVDVGRGISVDGYGAYVAGETWSSNFPVAPNPGAFQTVLAGNSDAFVAQLSVDGTALRYSTYLGGSEVDNARGIAVDSGEALITGETRSTATKVAFPAATSFQSGGWTGIDAFITKLSYDGTALRYSELLGGRQTDYGSGIAVDASGYAYVVGVTQSIDFPLSNAIQSQLDGNGQQYASDLFVAKLSHYGAGATSLIYSTYLGGSGIEQDHNGSAGIAADITHAEGDAYITATTWSTDFPTTLQSHASNAALQSPNAGYSDGIVAKITDRATSNNLSIVNVVSRNSFAIGDTVRYSMEVFNPGPDLANGVVVKATLSSGQQYVGASGPASCALTSATIVTCDVGTLLPSARVSANIELTATATGPISNTADVSHKGYDNDPNDNSSTASAMVFAMSFTGSGTATIDGTLTAGEWDNASCTSFNVWLPAGAGTAPATLCAMNDNANVYFSLRLDRARFDPWYRFVINFDNDHDGVMMWYDDAISVDGGIGATPAFGDLFQEWCGSSYCARHDIHNGGTSDGAGTLQYHSTYTVFELAHPLASGDWFDIGVCAGQQLGFSVTMAVVDLPGPSYTHWPAQPSFAELTLSGSCAP